mmetsp:Transcript_22584/g.42561  ORF Transcript_22584/g.42561 Transcript_22584/m.42561 type:complete len:315 (+) Transcript_22584:65-1009(+)
MASPVPTLTTTSTNWGWQRQEAYEKFLLSLVEPGAPVKPTLTYWKPLVKIVNWGVLGTGAVGGEEQRTGELPNECIVFVDPAGLHHITRPGGPKNASGAAGAIYTFLGIDKDDFFPPEVTAAITRETQAKFYVYGRQPCIHTVGPDFRPPAERKAGASREDYTEARAMELLTETYLNVLKEFCRNNSGRLRTLRLLPISGGIFSGKFKEQMPSLTAWALKGAMDLLEPAEMQMLETSKTELEMCIYMDTEAQDYQNACNQAGLRNVMPPQNAVPTPVPTYSRLTPYGNMAGVKVKTEAFPTTLGRGPAGYGPPM